MFYNVEILCMQRGGRLAKVWIAATRGPSVLSTREVLELDLEKLG